MFQTRITDFFGIRLPIIAGGIQWLSTAEYVGAAAKCGIMGFVTAGSFPDLVLLRDEIHRCREICEDRPFGVNVSMLPKQADNGKIDQIFNLLIDEGVRYVETSGRSPEKYLPRLHAAGAKVLHKVPTIKHALKAQSIGVDAVTVVGAECGGHPGMELVGTMVQAAVAARDITIPLVIGGGIGTGAQIVAALALGADGVAIGTRFLVAEEIWAHRSYKERLLQANETDTTLLLQSLRNTIRALRNETTCKIQQLEESHGGNLEILMPHISGKLGRLAYESGDTSIGTLALGQSVAFADCIEPLASIVERLEVDARRALERVGSLVN